MNMHKDHMLCLLTFIAVIVSCQKKDEVKPDPRDAIAGRYEVWDSLYIYEGMDSLGQPKYNLEHVFHYDVMEFVKARVMVIPTWGDRYETNGLTYSPVSTDTSYTSSNGYRYGQWVHKHDFQVSTENPFKISQTDNSLFGSPGYSGLVIDDAIFLHQYGDVGYSSAICIRIR